MLHFTHEDFAIIKNICDRSVKWIKRFQVSSPQETDDIFTILDKTIRPLADIFKKIYGVSPKIVSDTKIDEHILIAAFEHQIELLTQLLLEYTELDYTYMQNRLVTIIKFGQIFPKKASDVRCITKPRGRPPKGKVWDSKYGTWVDDVECQKKKKPKTTVRDTSQDMWGSVLGPTKSYSEDEECVLDFFAIEQK